MTNAFGMNHTTLKKSNSQNAEKKDDAEQTTEFRTSVVTNREVSGQKQINAPVILSLNDEEEHVNEFEKF